MLPPVKTIWTGRMAQAAGKYGESAPMAAVCCNACRTCVTTNIVGIVTAALAGAGHAVANFARRRHRTSVNESI
jgi:threonine aldolase